MEMEAQFTSKCLLAFTMRPPALQGQSTVMDSDTEEIMVHSVSLKKLYLADIQQEWVLLD